MGFGDIISNSFKDYKRNWISYSLFILILSGIPLIIFNVITIDYSINSGFYDKILSFQENGIEDVYSVFNLFVPFILMALIYFIISSFLSIIISRGIISSSAKGKSSLGRLFSSGISKYGITLGFFIVYFLFLTGLFLLLIIPGIIFSIYWILALYVFVYENKGIIDSLKRSFELVRNRWWLTVGYVLLFSIITWAISFAISIPSSIYGYFLQISLASEGISNSFIINTGIADTLTTLVVNCIVIPLGLLFGRNLYLEYRAKRAK